MTVDQDTLVSYALGTLTPQAEAEVAGYLGAHPEDAALVSGYLESLADFALLLPPEPLPETGEADLIARIRGTAPLAPVIPDAPPETQTGRPDTRQPDTRQPDAPATKPPPVIVVPKRPHNPNLWLAGLGAVAVAAMLYFAVVTFTDPNVRYARELEQYQAEPGAQSYALAVDGEAKPLGTLVRLQDGRVFVLVDAPPVNNQVYQAWNIGAAATSLGTFTDRAFLSQAAVPLGNTFGLTLEPPGGSDQPTTTPLTLVKL